MPENIYTQLRNELPTLAVALIKQHLDQTQPYNADFALHPDEPRHHKPQWHQWGILTHTDHFLQSYDTEVQICIDTWGLRTLYNAWMAQEIEGKSKGDLLRLGILYHDLGKFTTRHLSSKQHSTDALYPDFSFGGHEAASEVLIQQHLTERLMRLGYTSRQIWYIGRCAALHYEIAKIRDHIKNTHGGYSLLFVAGDIFAREATLLLEEFRDFAFEVGIMYLGDSLAKTAFRLTPEPTNDTERLVHPSLPEIKRLIAAEGLPENHIDCVLHVEVSKAAVKRYMELMQG